MSKLSNPGKPTVELRPSRIRRDPVPAQKPGEARTYWDPSEWDSWVVIVGVISFAVAIAIIIVGISDYTNG